MGIPAGPPDRIILQGIRVYGYHGANPEERAVGQCYVVDLSVEVDLRKPGDSDRLEDTVSYTGLYRAVRAVVGGEPKSLLEAAAQTLADKVLAEFPVNAVHVVLKKPHPPIKASVIDSAAVEIYRSRREST
jgi:dihydroneopterin aldolase